MGAVAAAMAAAERGGKERLGHDSPQASTPRAPGAMSGRAAQLHGDRAGHCLSPYLAHTGWQGLSSVCPRSWSPHTRTCLGPTPHCSQSARHLQEHKDRGHGEGSQQHLWLVSARCCRHQGHTPARRCFQAAVPHKPSGLLAGTKCHSLEHNPTLPYSPVGTTGWARGTTTTDSTKCPPGSGQY